MEAATAVPAGALEPRVLRIGDWTLDPERHELRRGDEAVRLEPKVIEVLLHLARRAGRLVGREELLASVWPGVIVGDDALTQAIIKLRKALGDEAQSPRYIETIPKGGYRLIAPVSDAAPARPGVGSGDLPPGNRGRRAYVAAAAVIVVSLGALLAIPRMPWPIASDTRAGPAATSIPTVAILPLSNLSGDSRREYFTDGMTEDIINALGRFSGIRVMSANAVQGFKGKAPAPRAIRDELGARYIVRGSVREAGGKVRVAIALSDAEQGAQLWSDQYEGEGPQLFEIQDRIVRDIAGALSVRVTQLDQQRALAKPTESMEAHDLLLRARALLYLYDRGANREARGLLARARKLAPEYAELLNDSGSAEFQRATYGWMEDAGEGIRRAEEFGKQAIASADPRAHPRAHSLLASIYGHLDRFDEALRHADRALELNPSDATVLFRRGATLLFAGRVEEAIGTMETARRFEPYPSAANGVNLSIAYYVTGRYRDALAYADALAARSPGQVTVNAMRAACLAQLGDAVAARRVAEEVRRLSPMFEVENFGTRFADPAQAAKLHEGLRKAGL